MCEGNLEERESNADWQVVMPNIPAAAGAAACAVRMVEEWKTKRATSWKEKNREKQETSKER
jgi:hypothetical protein